MKINILAILLLSFCLVVRCLGDDLDFPSLPPAKTVLIFSPHPDDELIGCGGTIIQYVRRGVRVVIVFMTSGEAYLPSRKPQKLAELRENEAKRALEKVGVEDLIFLRGPDGKLSKIKNKAINKIENLLLKYLPEVIYIPHANEDHQDHQATFQIVTAALEKLAPDRLPLTLCYEVWTPLQRFAHVVNIGGVIDLKLEALHEYRSQIACVDYSEAIKGLNRYRGIMANKKPYAECFLKLVRNR